MDDCFNFESGYRISSDVKMLGFNATDGTEWTLTEEWLISQITPRILLQRLIFTKENHYDRHYFINVEITPVNNHQASGKIKVVAKSKSVLTKLIIPLDKYRIFQYSVCELRDKHNIRIADRVLTDLFRYKVTISRAHFLQEENDEVQVPRGDQLMVFSEHFLSLLETGNLSDVVLSDGQLNMRAHRCILSSRSRVFRVMFKQDMRERRDGIVYIRDIDFKIVKEMVRYMYTGVLRAINVSTAYGLYVAAHMYELKELKEICSSLMARHLIIDNAVCISRLAYVYEEHDLQEACFRFILENFDEMETGGHLIILKKNCPEFFEKVMAKHQSLIMN